MGKMKLSTVFELLLIFLFIAFAASRNLGETKVKVLRKEENNTKPATTPALGSCKCATLQCNCCRHFSLPLVSVKGPGCASITYLNGNSLRLTMSFGDRVLRNITLAGKKPNPVCMSLPGGVSKFCGRIYGIQREGDHFRSCLALELRALDDIEAALRVSCFTFGPQGVRRENSKIKFFKRGSKYKIRKWQLLGIDKCCKHQQLTKLEPARPLPASSPDDEDDEDDEDDDYGLDEDSDFGLDDDEEDDTENDVDSSEIDYTGFSALSDEFLESFFESSGSKKKQTYIQHQVTAPTIVLAENPTKLQDIKETLIPITAPSTSEMPDYTTQNPTIVESQQKADKTNLNSTDGLTQGEESSEEEQLDNTHNQTDLHRLDTVKEEESLHDNDDNMKEPLQIQDSKMTQQPSVNNNYTDEFRQLRSYVPRTAFAPITLAEQEQRFPGLSALIKRQAHHKTVNDDVISQWHSPINQPASMSFDFPPARSARNHKKMRFPLDS